MSTEKLKQRYLHIAKESLGFLKQKGFTKKGMNYTKVNEEIIIQISSSVPRAWSNCEDFYEYDIFWQIFTTNQEFIDLYMFMEGDKNLKKASIAISGVYTSDLDLKALDYLKPTDSPEKDQQTIDKIREGMEHFILPLIQDISSIDEMMLIAEEEEKIERSKRIFYGSTGIYRVLTNFYAFKGWKDKMLEACQKYIETIPATARHLAEKDKQKYLKYFEQFKK